MDNSDAQSQPEAETPPTAPIAEATPTAPADSGATSPETGQKRVYILLILGLVFFSLIAAGVVWWLVASKPKKKKAKKEEEPPPEKPNLNPTLLKLENTILGISTDGSEGKVQVEVTLMLAAPELTAQVKPWLPEIEANIQRYLASLTSEQLKSTDFRNQQREELRGILNQKIRTSFEEPITQVLYHNYVFVY